MQQDDSADSDNATTTQLSDLPVALLGQILQHVPQQQRLCSAAFVCSDWAAAVARATVRLQHALNPNFTPVLEAWVNKHAAQLESIQLCPAPGRRLTLQFQWASLTALQCLELDGANLGLSARPRRRGHPPPAPMSGSGSSSSSEPALLPQLHDLELHTCMFDSMECVLRLASSSSSLTRLVMSQAGFMDERRANTGMSQLLQRQPQLQVLLLQDVPLSSDAAQHIGAMQHLQDLQLLVAPDARAKPGSFVATLPGSLTRLGLCDYRNRRTQGATAASNPTLPPQLPALTSLQILQLNWCSFWPAVLAGMPQLRHLEVMFGYLQPGGPGRMVKPEAVAALLSAVQQMTQLQHFEIERVMFDATGVPLPQFAALTASTQLTTLFLVCDNDGPVLPAGSLHHMFPAGRQLPHLRQLHLPGLCGSDGLGTFMDGQDLARVMNSCPALVDCDVCNALHAGADLSALVNLAPSCRRLGVGGATDAAAPFIAQLTQLTCLHWWWAPGLSDAGVQQLTALRGLKQLLLADCGSLSDELMGWDDRGGRARELRLEDDGDEEPVWQQLLERLDYLCTSDYEESDE